MSASGANLHIESHASTVTHEAVTDGLTDDLPTPVVSDGDASSALRTTVVAEVAAEADFRRGQRVSLEFEPTRMHFFDLETGATLRARAENPDPSASEMAKARTGTAAHAR